MVGLGTDAKYDGAALRAAAKVFAEHGSFIRAIIRFQASDESHEEDLWQEFFLTLVRRPMPSDVRNVKSYLYRAITNDVVDMTRRQEKYQHHVKKHAEEIRISINKATPADAIIETEDSDSVFGYLTRQLRRRESQAVTMRYRRNYSIAQIAAEMGVDKRTVSRYLSSGLRRLRAILAIE